MRKRRIIAWAGSTFGLLVLLFLSRLEMTPQAQTENFLGLTIQVEPERVHPNDTLTYILRLQNCREETIQDIALDFSLPPGFAYESGSAQLLYNQVLVSQPEPRQQNTELHWTSLDVPPARLSSFWGMHAFIQDRCQRNYIHYQLDRIRELMGPQAFVKQLFYRITPETPGPLPCWVEFVQACYDRDLIPVVRLQGEYEGPYWAKPPQTASGDYGEIARAFARVVAGLPRQDGHLLLVEIWNEPNLDIEWGGEANPIEYAQFLVEVAAALRALNDPRIILLNGALSPGGDYDRLAFIDKMATVPGALDAFDVWASHPYPGNHPPEYNIHDGTAPLYPELTIDSYLLELERLAAHGRTGVQVLLTETGYALGQNNFVFQGYPPIEEANRADYISRAFADHWSRWPEVLGVCPYELVDPSGAWAMWDWLYPSGQRHLQYDAVAALDKTPPLAKGELVLRFRARVGEQTGVFTCNALLRWDSSSSITLEGAAPVQVVLPPPSPTPTNTPTPSCTPTPTITPVCYPVLQNGSFERDEAWEIPDTVYPAAYSENMAHSGERSLRLGIPQGDPVLSYSSARQAFYVPNWASEVHIEYWYYPLSQDTDHDRQYVLLLDSEKRYLETLMWLASDAQEWQYREHILRGYAGQTLWLHFGVYNDDTDGTTAMYVDDVNLEVCGPEELVTPIPTIPPQPTSSPTSTPQPTLIFPSPMPTASPTRRPCKELITNGDFENAKGWTIPNTSYPARYEPAKGKDSSRAMVLGIESAEENLFSYSSAEQTIDLPQGVRLVLSFWYYPIAGDGPGDRQYVLLINQEGDYTTLLWEHKDTRRWLRKSFDLTAFGGQRMTLRFGVYNDGQDGVTAMYIDDVSLQACPWEGNLWLPLLWKSPSRESEHSLSSTTSSPNIDYQLPSRPRGLVSLTSSLAAEQPTTIRALAFDEQRRRLLVAEGSRLTAIEGITGKTLFSRQFDLPIGDIAIATDTGIAYIALPEKGRVRAISPENRVVSQSPDVGYPTRLCLSKSCLYVADSAKKRLIVLDMTTCSIITMRSLPEAPYALAYDSSKERIYVGIMGRGSILALDAKTLDLKSELPLGGLGYPLDLVLDESGHLYVAYLISPKYGALASIDTTTMQPVASLRGTPQEPLYQADGLALDRKKKLLYLSLPNAILQIETQSLAVQSRIQVSRSRWPGLIAMDSLGETLYFAGKGGQLWSWR